MADESEPNIYKTRILWRDTMREPRMVLFDARIVFFFLLLAAHLAVWTFVLLLAAIVVFWFVERAGFRFPSALRVVRSTFAGVRRPAVYQRYYRRAIDYGFEYRIGFSNPDGWHIAVSDVKTHMDHMISEG